MTPNHSPARQAPTKPGKSHPAFVGAALALRRCYPSALEYSRRERRSHNSRPWVPMRRSRSVILLRAPLNNSLRSLRGLKRADAIPRGHVGRVAQGMAVALFKRRNAADVRFRPRLSMPSGYFGAFRLARTPRCTLLDIAPLCLRKCALITDQPESQRAQGVIQRFPKIPRPRLRKNDPDRGK